MLLVTKSIFMGFCKGENGPGQALFSKTVKDFWIMSHLSGHIPDMCTSSIRRGKSWIGSKSLPPETFTRQCYRFPDMCTSPTRAPLILPGSATFSPICAPLRHVHLSFYPEVLPFPRCVGFLNFRYFLNFR